MQKIKRSYAIVIVLIWGVHSIGFSQFVKKGSILGNGSAMYKATKDLRSHSTWLELTPWVGYFVKDNLVLGVGFNYAFSSSQGTVTINYVNNALPSQVMTVDLVAHGFTVGPVVRYYFNSGFFLNAEYGLGIQRFNRFSLFNPNSSDYNLGIFRGGLGYAFRVTKRIMLEPMACYTSQVSTNRITGVESNERGYIFLISFTMLLKLE